MNARPELAKRFIPSEKMQIRYQDLELNGLNLSHRLCVTFRGIYPGLNPVEIQRRYGARFKRPALVCEHSCGPVQVTKEQEMLIPRTAKMNRSEQGAQRTGSTELYSASLRERIRI